MIFKKVKKSITSFDFKDPWQDDAHCFISDNLLIEGSVKFSGTLRIDGKVNGPVSAAEGKKGLLILSRGAQINGAVKVTQLITDGVINGDVNADIVECRADSFVKGSIEYQTLNLTAGAKVEGRTIKKGNSDNRFLGSMSVPSLATKNNKRKTKI